MSRGRNRLNYRRSSLMGAVGTFVLLQSIDRLGWLPMTLGEAVVGALLASQLMALVVYAGKVIGRNTDVWRDRPANPPNRSFVMVLCTVYTSCCGLAFWLVGRGWDNGSNLFWVGLVNGIAGCILSCLSYRDNIGRGVSSARVGAVT